ncbi:MAG: SusC/RagA family TonB-linked outer membrane protein, partial [Sphingobacteriales bacterium]
IPTIGKQHILFLTINPLFMRKKLSCLLSFSMAVCSLQAQLATDQQLAASHRPEFRKLNPATGTRDVTSPFNGRSAGLVINKLVSGNVTDDAQRPLSGVSVTLINSSIGTTTDVSGRYSLSIPDDRINDSLVFSSVGYEDKTVAIGGQETLNITLSQNINSLNQVVVVGYGTQKRVAVTAAISSVAMKEIKDMPVSNVATALQGKVPGVVVQQNSGAPGSTPAIKVRGLGSISAGNSPLIVVDGNIVSPAIFGLLNSNEIVSMDVLKDASSTAIYGSRGSNGVIIVTTRRGKSGRTNINLDVYGGFQEVTKKIDLLNSAEMAELSKEAANNAYLDNVPGAKITDPNSMRSVLRYRYPRGEVFPWLNFDDPQKIAELPDYDLQDLIF